MQVIDLHLYLKYYSSTGAFSHILLKTNCLVCLNGTLAENGLISCFEIPFTKNVVSLETSQLFCITNHLTSFCLIIVLTKKYPVSLLMFQKVFQVLISSDINVNLWFSFLLWSVTSGTSHLEFTLFICCI